MSDEITTWEGAPEEELAAREKVEEWSREKSAISNMIQTELGLYKTVLTAGAIEKLQNHIFWRMCSFLDEDEAKDWVDCYHEARDLNMSVDWNIDSVFALCSANRKIGRTSVISAVLEAISGARHYANTGGYENKDRGKEGEKRVIA